MPTAMPPKPGVTALAPAYQRDPSVFHAQKMRPVATPRTATTTMSTTLQRRFRAAARSDEEILVDADTIRALPVDGKEHGIARNGLPALA
jgi:hypothetical protein